MAPRLQTEEEGEREETRTRISQLEGMLEEAQEKCRGLDSQVTNTQTEDLVGGGSLTNDP